MSEVITFTKQDYEKVVFRMAKLSVETYPTDLDKREVHITNQVKGQMAFNTEKQCLLVLLYSEYNSNSLFEEGLPNPYPKSSRELTRLMAFSTLMMDVIDCINMKSFS